MVQSKAKTVAAYLKELEPSKCEVIKPVLACIRKNIRPGFQESMSWGMISYEVPLDVYPKTYNKKPMLYCSLAAQKNHFAVYMMCAYSGSKQMEMLEAGYKKAGIPLKMGKCCIRFKNLDEVHLPTIGRLIKSCTVKQWIEMYEACRND